MTKNFPVTGSEATGPAHSRPWAVPIARAIPAAASAVVITFTGAHSAAFGLAVFGGFAIASGIVLAVLVALTSPAGRTRSLLIVQGAITAAAGVAALVGRATGTSDVAWLIVLVSAWAAVTGFLELYAGIRTRGVNPFARDWIFAGALTAVLALGALLVPPGLSQPFEGQNEVAGELTASVVVVGVLGAYAAILAVFLIIAGLSLKWAQNTTDAAGRSEHQDGTPT